MNVQIMNDEAVSPVIGVILMVAITVILAATIAIFVFGETDKLETTKIVSLQGSATSDFVTVSISGGSDLAGLEKLTFQFATEEQHPGYIIGNGILTKSSDNKGYQNGVLLPTATNGTNTEKKLFVDDAFHTGDTIKMPNLGGDFKVIGTFADGAEQILFSKTYAEKPNSN